MRSSGDVIQPSGREATVLGEAPVGGHYVAKVEVTDARSGTFGYPSPIAGRRSGTDRAEAIWCSTGTFG